MRCLSYAEAFRQKSASGRLYTVFHCFWCREPNLPAASGRTAGTSLWPAFAGLAVSAVGLPIAGVVAVARAGGLDRLAGRVHPVFAMVFTILVYLSIGPCLAIPRTASTSFQMLVPLIGGGTGLQLAYSVLFFAAAFLVALRPEKLTDWLGRILCPCLIVLIVVLFAGCLIHPLAAHYGTPSAEYAPCPLCRASCTATRPWTRWPG